MRISETQVKAGFFWVQSDPDNRVPGTLTITDGGRIELDVLSMAKALEHQDDHYARIVGLVEDDGFVTLDDCFSINTSWQSVGLTKTKIFAHTAFFGVQMGLSDAVALKSFEFSVEGLEAWLDETRIEGNPDLRSTTATLTYTPHEPVVIPIEGKRVKFQSTWSTSHQVAEAKIVRRAHIIVESDELRPLGEFMALAHKITNFFCLALDEAVSINAAWGTVMATAGDGPEEPTRIRIVYQSLPFTERVPKGNWRRMLFSYRNVKDSLSSKLTRWFAAYDVFAPTLSLYFAATTGAHKFTNGKFLSLAQAVETYHRRTSDEKLMLEDVYVRLVSQLLLFCPTRCREWLQRVSLYGNEIGLGRRVKRVMSLLGDRMGNGDERKRLARTIADTRNYLTHYNEDLKEKAAKGADLAYLCFRMEALLQLLFLRELEFSDEEVATIVTRSSSLTGKLKGRAN